MPYFHLISWYGNFAERHSFNIVLGESPETMQKLCLSAKFSHQEISWNCGIFHSDGYVGQKISQESLRRFCYNFDFLPSTTSDTRDIIWCISFTTNTFEWTENPFLLEVTIRHKNSWFFGFNLQIKERLSWWKTLWMDTLHLNEQTLCCVFFLL